MKLSHVKSRARLQQMLLAAEVWRGLCLYRTKIHCSSCHAAMLEFGAFLETVPVSEEAGCKTFVF